MHCLGPWHHASLGLLQAPAPAPAIAPAPAPPSAPPAFEAKGRPGELFLAAGGHCVEVVVRADASALSLRRSAHEEIDLKIFKGHLKGL